MRLRAVTTAEAGRQLSPLWSSARNPSDNSCFASWGYTQPGRHRVHRRNVNETPSLSECWVTAQAWFAHIVTTRAHLVWEGFSELRHDEHRKGVTSFAARHAESSKPRRRTWSRGRHFREKQSINAQEYRMKRCQAFCKGGWVGNRGLRLEKGALSICAEHLRNHGPT